MKKVSVVILNWNGARLLRAFLPSVVKYSPSDFVDIYVVDNASTDDSINIVSNDFPEVKLISFQKNYGFAEGYNRAISQIKSEYVVLLNSDVEVSEGWISAIIDYMDLHQDVAACQPKILSYGNKEYFEYAGASGGFIDKFGYPFCRGRIFDVLEKDRGQYDDVSEVFWVSGAAMFIRRDVYLNAGSLDNRFFAHMEEIDLCWRLLSIGYKLVCVPASKVYHVGGGTLNKENPRKTYLNFRNNLIMLFKNLPSDRIGNVMRVRRFLDYLAILFFILKFDLPNARAVIKARRDYFSMISDFEADRKKNLSNSKVTDFKCMYNHSLIWRNKICRKKYYSDLMGK